MVDGKKIKKKNREKLLFDFNIAISSSNDFNKLLTKKKAIKASFPSTV